MSFISTMIICHEGVAAPATRVMASDLSRHALTSTVSAYRSRVVV